MGEEDDLLVLECDSCGKQYSIPWVNVSVEDISTAHRMHKAIAHDNPAYPTEQEFRAIGVVSKTIAHMWTVAMGIMIITFAYRTLT